MLHKKYRANITMDIIGTCTEFENLVRALLHNDVRSAKYHYRCLQYDFGKGMDIIERLHAARFGGKLRTNELINELDRPFLQCLDFDFYTMIDEEGCNGILYKIDKLLKKSADMSKRSALSESYAHFSRRMAGTNKLHIIDDDETKYEFGTRYAQTLDWENEEAAHYKKSVAGYDVYRNGIYIDKYDSNTKSKYLKEQLAQHKRG